MMCIWGSCLSAFEKICFHNVDGEHFIPFYLLSVVSVVKPCFPQKILFPSPIFDMMCTNVHNDLNFVLLDLYLY